MWPSKNTAILVVHGNLPQKPFAVLDHFARGIGEALQEANPGQTVVWNHKLRRRQGWIENYISLALPGRPVVDIYEYYWDRHMVREVSAEDIADWIIKSSEGGRKFYLEQAKTKDIGDNASAQPRLFEGKRFKFGAYLVLLEKSGVPLQLMYGFVARLKSLEAPLIKLLRYHLAWLLRRRPALTARINEFFGDVITYTTTDARSRHYEIRRKILADGLDETTALLKDPAYERIICAGHSLGSLILYDIFNRLLHEMNSPGGLSAVLAPKMAGLVTFGSPLDAVAFFFREVGAADEYVRRQIIAHYHGFKRPFEAGRGNEAVLSNPIEPYLDRTRWLNFHHHGDIFCAPIDAYRDVENIPTDDPASGPIEAHGSYWHSGRMYRAIVNRLLT